MSVLRITCMVVLLFFLACVGGLYAQGYKVDMKLAFWADTTLWNDAGPIIKTYKNYLESRPDSDYNNPHWNEREKKMYKKFDFSRGSLFQKGGWCTSKFVFNNYSVVVLNVEKKDSATYLIQSMLWGDSLGKNNERLNPLAMHRYYIIKEGDNWKMANALFYDTKNWMTKESEFILYHFPVANYYSDSLANLNEQFCKMLMRRFHLPKPARIEVFAVDGKHEIGKLLGFDYYFMGYAEGRSIENIIMCGAKSIYYPHELVHQFFQRPRTRDWFVDEGLAVWLGGSMGKTYLERAQLYAKSYSQIDSAGFERMYRCEELDCYPLAGIVFDIIHETAGDKGIMSFIEQETDESLEKLYLAIKTATGLAKHEFLNKFNQKIQYLSKM